MSIKAGSFADPVEYLGLAHFHEHMLFLGTEKYPDEDEYEKYLKDHGGFSNAYTSDEFTNYYFRVNAPHLSGALDRFSQFFLAPTFNPDSVDREMRAVDSESTNYAGDEGWRRLQVMKATTANQHPFHKFSVGNLDTLGHSGPTAAREELIKWNAEHYHAGVMRLAISGKESLDELESYARSLFAEIREAPAQKATMPETPTKVLPWSDMQLSTLVEFVPKIEDRTIGVLFPLPPAATHLYGKVEYYLSHLIGHEGEGSLHALLNKKGYIEGLSAGPEASFSDAQLFGIEVSLTLEGERNINEVLDAIFAYVALMREAGPNAKTYEEIRLLNEVGFRFAEESPAPENFCASASGNLQFYPARDALRGPSAIDDWMPETVESWMSKMTPDRCLIIRGSPEFEVEAGDDLEVESTVPAGAWGREQWYGARFRRRALTAEELARWSQPSEAAREGLHMPEANPFVPHDFSLRCDASGAKPQSSVSPSALDVVPPTKLSKENSMTTLWSKTDSTFRVPKAFINAHIMTPVYKMGPAAVMGLRLFCALLSDDLNKYAYSAYLAGLSYSVSFSDRLTFAVGGFNDKLPQLLSEVAGRLRSLLKELEEVASAPDDNERKAYWAERLETQRELLLREYENFFREDPLKSANYNMRQVLLANAWHLAEYIDILKGTSGASFLKPLTEHVRAALAQIQLEVLAHGNVADKEAESIAETLQKTFASSSNEDAKLPGDALPMQSVVLLPAAPDHTVIYDFDMKESNPDEENSAIINVYQVGPCGQDPLQDACLTMVSHLAETSSFTQLRTKEQLGYIASAGYSRLYDVDAMSVVVQGPRLPPAGMDERIEAWFVQFRQELEDMDEEVFAINVQSVIDVKCQRNKQLGQETGQHWIEIVKRTYRFDHLKQEVDALRKVTKAQIIEFFDRHLAAGAPQRRKLSSRVYGEAARRDMEKQEGPVSEAPSTRMATFQEAREFKGKLPTHGTQ